MARSCAWRASYLVHGKHTNFFDFKEIPWYKHQLNFDNFLFQVSKSEEIKMISWNFVMTPNKVI